MFPVIFSIGPATIYSFGLFLVGGFFVGTFLIWREAYRIDLDDKKLFDLLLIVILSSLLAGRLFYVILHWEEFGFNILRFLAFFWFGGFSFWGAILGGFAAYLVYIRKRLGWDFWKTADTLVFGLTAGQIFLDAGKFLGGIDAGRNTGWFLGINFPAYLGKRHPVSLYEIVFLVLLFWFLIKVKNARPQGEKFPTGFLFLVFAGLYFLIHFLLDFFREGRLYLLRLTIDQWISLALFGLSLFILHKKSAKLRRLLGLKRIVNNLARKIGRKNELKA